MTPCFVAEPAAPDDERATRARAHQRFEIEKR